ncbi:hypothetical protein ACWY4P_20935 [Streptomyces sp. LZ34]
MDDVEALECGVVTICRIAVQGPAETVDGYAMAATAGGRHLDGLLDDLGPVALGEFHGLPRLSQNLVQGRSLVRESGHREAPPP